MNSPKIITHSGLALNISEVKCFYLSFFANDGFGKRNTLIVEFKTRYGYIQHPVSEEFELQEYNEKTEVEFPDYETAKTYTDEWIEIWQDYLDKQT